MREAEKGAPVKGARVVINWTNLVLGPSGAVRVPRSVVATAGHLARISSRLVATACVPFVTASKHGPTSVCTW